MARMCDWREYSFLVFPFGEGFSPFYDGHAPHALLPPIPEHILLSILVIFFCGQCGSVGMLATHPNHSLSLCVRVCVCVFVCVVSCGAIWWECFFFGGIVLDGQGLIVFGWESAPPQRFFCPPQGAREESGGLHGFHSWWNPVNPGIPSLCDTFVSCT